MLRPYTARSIRRTPEHGHADLRAKLLQLLAGGGAREVRRHKSRSLLLELQPPRELRRGGGLPRALQPDQQDHRWPDRRELQGRATLRADGTRQVLVRGPQHPGNLVMHELDHLLAGAHRLHRDRPDCALAHPLDEPLGHFEADVGLEQMPPDLAQGLGHVLLREHSTTGEALQSGGQPLGESRKHKPTKLLSDLRESKWGDSTCRAGDPNRGHPFPALPTQRRIDQAHDRHADDEELLDLRASHTPTPQPPLGPRALESLPEARGRRLVVPQRVPHERFRSRSRPRPRPRPALLPEHLVAVAVPACRQRRGRAVVAQMLLEEEANLELAQTVFVAHGIARRRLERQRIRAVPGRIPGGVQDLLGGDRHEDAVGLLPGVLVVEPAHELGAPQVREDQALAQPQRRAPEHLHLILLAAERRPQLPEVGQAFDLLLRHEHQDLGERRLSFEDRLRRAATIVLALQLHQRVEVQVLVLQRVHQLVRDHQTRLAGIDVGRDVERVRVGIEIARHLLGQEVDHGAAQVERIGDQTEQPIRSLRAGELGGREVVIELVDDVVANLRAAAAQHDGTLAKAQAGGPFDGGDHLLHGLLQLRLALDLPRPLLASRASHRSDRRRRGEAPSDHGCHSIPLPTAAPTTRAMSCPLTTMPWCSNSARSSWSSSARLSARDGGGRWQEVADGGGWSEVTPTPPSTAFARPSPPSIFSISAPIRSSIGKISATRSSAGSAAADSWVSPRRIIASTLRRSRMRRSSSGDTRAAACAWAQASSSTSIALSGRARSGTNRSVSTMAALRASSVMATAWCRSRRDRRATRTSHVWIASSSSTPIGWNRRSSAGSPRIHLSYSPPVVAPMMRMSPRTSAGFSMLAASIAAPSAVPWPIRLCSSSTNRIRSGSVDSSRTSLRIRSSYCPRNAVPASRATWSRATMRASFRAGGTSAAAMRCASPSTMAVFPTPAFPISAGLFLLWRSRMSTARAISASRQRTGSRSPRRAWAVRSMPMRSSSALPPESNSPSNGSPMRSPRPQEPQIPVDDGIAEHEHDGRAHGEEYPERDVTLLAPK